MNWSEIFHSYYLPRLVHLVDILDLLDLLHLLHQFYRRLHLHLLSQVMSSQIVLRWVLELTVLSSVFLL